MAQGSVPLIPITHFWDNSGLLWRLQDLSPDAVTHSPWWCSKHLAGRRHMEWELPMELDEL